MIYDPFQFFCYYYTYRGIITWFFYILIHKFHIKLHLTFIFFF